MKKTLAVIWVILIVTGATAQDAKKDSPFEGWSVIRGKWEQAKDGTIVVKSVCEFQLNDLPEKYVQLSFSLQIIKGSENPNTKGTGLTLTWDREPDGSDGIQKALLFKDTQLKIHSFPAKPQLSSPFVPCRFNSRRPVRVLLKITRNSVAIKAGTISLDKSYNEKPIGLVRLHIPEGTEIKILKMKVKSK